MSNAPEITTIKPIVHTGQRVVWFSEYLSKKTAPALRMKGDAERIEQSLEF